jgi:hypothetical protein
MIKLILALRLNAKPAITKPKKAREVGSGTSAVGIGELSYE